MKYQLSLSRKVERQIYGITRWYADQDADVAEQWYSGLLTTMNGLRRNPHSHPLAHESDDFPFEIRELLYGSGRRKTHRILFRIENDLVKVLAVLHIAQADLTPGDV